MKKSIAYGIILFFVGSFMMGCGKSSKSASNPTPTNTTTNNVSNFFGNNGSTLNNVSGKTFTVTNSAKFQQLLNSHNGSNGLNLFNTNYGVANQAGNCAAGILFGYGLSELSSWLGGNSSEVNVNCIGGILNGNTGTQGLAGSYPASITSAVSGQYIRGSITTVNRVISFDAQYVNATTYIDNNNNIGIGPNGNNQLIVYYLEGSTYTPVGYITL